MNWPKPKCSSFAQLQTWLYLKYLNETAMNFNLLIWTELESVQLFRGKPHVKVRKRFEIVFEIFMKFSLVTKVSPRIS